MPSKFKPGMKVLCIRNYINKFSRGETYTIKRHRNGCLYVCDPKEPDNGFGVWWESHGDNKQFFEYFQMTKEDDSRPRYAKWEHA